MNKSDKLFDIANEVAAEIHGFFLINGPGKGNKLTNSYIHEVGRRARELFGEDFSEKKLCGENSLKVDFYFPDEATIVEIALGLSKPNTEYEKDILKAIMAKNLGNKVNRLLFFCKPGGEKKCRQPGRSAVKHWLNNNVGIELEVRDLNEQI